jgi:hypothetical protein
MSDYEVTLVNDNSTSNLLDMPTLLTPYQCTYFHFPLSDLIPSRQEFYVRFKGPEESASTSSSIFSANSTSSILRRHLEDPRRNPRPVSIQEPLDWVC